MEIPVTRRARPVIPLTSLVDVVFILLFFFMLASSYSAWRAIDLNLSGPGTTAVAPVGQTRILQLQRDGAMLLDGAEMDRAALLAEMSRADDLRLIVQPGEGVNLQSVVSLMDALRATGVRMAMGREATQ